MALCVEQDTLAEEIEAGPAEHLALEHLDSVDVSFDNTGTPGQGEADDDSGAVSVDARGEAVETGQVVLADAVEPVREPFALALGKHPGEGPHVTGECIELGALGQYGLEPY